MNDYYTNILLCLFSLSILGGYLATGKKSKRHEDLGHLLILVLGFGGAAFLSRRGFNHTPIEVFGVVVATVEILQSIAAVVGGSLFGVWLWRDRRPRAKHPATDPRPGTLE